MLCWLLVLSLPQNTCVWGVCVHSLSNLTLGRDLSRVPVRQRDCAGACSTHNHAGEPGDVCLSVSGLGVQL